MELPYTETPTYIRLLTRTRATYDELLAERTALKALKKRDRTIEQHHRFVNLVGRLDTALRHIKEVLDLKITTWYLLQMVMEAEGTLWTEEEKVMWHKVLASHEGRGEQALKRRKGLSEAPSRTDGDLEKWIDGIRTLYEEVKNLQGHSTNGQFVVQNIQTGKHGNRAHERWCTEMYNTRSFEGVSDELKNACFGGEISSKVKEKLPSVVQASIDRFFTASSVLGSYQAINGTTREGFIWIPTSDFDAAWELDNITKHGPKYSLRPEYLVARLKKTLLSVVSAAA